MYRNNLTEVFIQMQINNQENSSTDIGIGKLMLCEKRKESGITLFSRCFGTETNEETRLHGS